jgi:peroxisomal 2,4-dienoyl-CoA reductase
MSNFRENLFEGKVALITGGGTGICRGIAEALAQHGAATALLSRRAEHVEPTARQIAAATNRECLPLLADVRQPEAVAAAVTKVLEHLGRLDIVINGAAGNFVCPAADLSPNGFGVVLDIDAKGTWNVSRAAYAAWLGAHGGQILNISATLHYGGTPAQLHVAAAKAAVDALTRNLAVEWGPRGIRVNAIAPGPIADTEGASRLFPGEAADRLRHATPVRRLGMIADVAHLALFLLSDAAAHINGAIVVTDGGLCLTGNFGRGLDNGGLAKA